MKTVLLASLVLAVTSASSFAGTPWINARQNAQKQRIINGAVSGRLTLPETVKLAQGQAHVQNLENQAKADGVVTPFERLRIHTAQNVQSARIFIKKHN
jgi:phage terminase Nu1 subunit (DNA packaging protein)